MPVLVGTLLAVLLVLVLANRFGSGPASASDVGHAFTGSVASPQVHTAINLGNPDLHPDQLAYDRARNGLWFWTSTQQRGVQIENRVIFFDIAHATLHSWPIYSGDWSSQLLAGLAVSPTTGDVWIGWNHNLVDFHPSDGSSIRYVLPAHPTFPLPASVIGDLPADLGIADLAISHDGTVWLARYGALSLTSFSPTTRSFSEHALPRNVGDPAKLAIGPDGHIFFTTNLSADHPGYGAEKVGEFDPQTRHIWVFAQPALALAVAPNGDLYTVIGGAGYGLVRLPAAERVNAEVLGRAPVFQRSVVPFATDDRSLTVDGHGRLWLAVAGQPQLAVLDPATGNLARYQYVAPADTGLPARDRIPGVNPVAPLPGAVYISHIVTMTTDSQGHLWYVRAGHDTIEEVAA